MTTTECQWCGGIIPFGSIDIFTIITSTNHQVFHFCNKKCARDWLVKIND